MKTSTKVIIGSIAGVLMAGMLLFTIAFTRVVLATKHYAQDRAVTQPVQVLTASEAIAEMTVPDGYAPSFTVASSGFSAVGYDHADGRSHLYLVQTPDWLIIDPEALARRLQESADREPLAADSIVHVEDRTVTVRGQQATLSIDDGVNHQGVAWRQAAVVFRGEQGTVLLLLEEPLARWDETRLEQLLASIE